MFKLKLFLIRVVTQILYRNHGNTTIHLHLIIMKLLSYNFEQLQIKMYKFGQGRI